MSRGKQIALGVAALAIVALVGHYLGWGTVFVLAVALVFVFPSMIERRRRVCLERTGHGYPPE